MLVPKPSPAISLLIMYYYKISILALIVIHYYKKELLSKIISRKQRFSCCRTAIESCNLQKKYKKTITIFCIFFLAT